MLAECFFLFFFSKREGQIHSNFYKQMFVHLARIPDKVVLLAFRVVEAMILLWYCAAYSM